MGSLLRETAQLARWDQQEDKEQVPYRILRKNLALKQARLLDPQGIPTLGSGYGFSLSRSSRSDTLARLRHRHDTRFFRRDCTRGRGGSARPDADFRWLRLSTAAAPPGGRRSAGAGSRT